MSTAEQPSPMTWYPDRGARLLLLGVFQILLGCLSLLMAAMIGVASLLGPLAPAQPRQAMNMQAMIPSIVIYLLVAVAFIWLGIGLARARRWAWTLTVVLSWIWLIMGVAAIIMFAFLAGPMMRAAIAPQQGRMPPEAIMTMQLVGGACVGCIYIVLPSIFLVFCQGDSVCATCYRRDPKTPWTDRCPMPVLAMSILFTFSFASMSSVMVYGIVMPFFGIFLSGAAGAAVLVVIELVLAYLAWGTYRLQMAAWWGSLLVGIAGALNMAITFSYADLMAVYEKMKMPPDQLEMMRKIGFAESMSQLAPWMALVGGTAWVGYLLYVRRYFIADGEEIAATSPQA